MMLDFSRCLVVATIGNREPDILAIRQPWRKFRMEIIDHGDKDRGVGAFQWKGYKWQNIARMFACGIIDLDQFDYVFFPDDDVEIECQAVHNLFISADYHKLRLCQPAMAANSSNIGWPVTSHVSGGAAFRHTNFVEILAPLFSVDALKICLPTFTENYSAWGLDFVWPKLLGYAGIGVIDAIQMKHTGTTTSADWTMPNGKTPRQEMDETLAKYGMNYEDCRAGVRNI